MRKRFGFAAAALLVGPFAGTAPAEPIYELSILASTSQNGTYSSSLQVQAGTTYYYEVEYTINGVGTSNTNQNGRTITTLVAGVDGFNSLAANLVNDGVITSALSILSVNTSVFTALGTSGGTASGTGVTGIRGTAAVGVELGVASLNTPTEVLVGTGTFTTASTLGAGLTSTITGSYVSGASTTGKINDGMKAIVISSITETGSDPYVGYRALTLTTAPAVVPEPTSIVMVGLSGAIVAGVVAARRRKR